MKNFILKGYRRDDNSFGFRNHILIIPSVHCANKVVEKIAKDTQGSVYITHQHGCSELDYDARQTQDVLVGHGCNPNVYGVLVVGLGCEVVQAKEVAGEIQTRTPYKEVAYLNIQECGGNIKTIQKGIEIVQKMLHERLDIKISDGDFSDVVLGTECGGSDSFSGLSANPALGLVSDYIIDCKGAVILAETTELIGAEYILAKRAQNEEVKQKILHTIKQYEENVINSHADIRGANPSPGNIAGGLSSIEEKSLGCIYKAGTRNVVDVIDYAKAITQKGLTFMNTPGNDIEQLSGMVAGGCNLCVFTTGRGTPTGSPITPTIKVSSNTATFVKMNDMIDIDAGGIIRGVESMEDVRNIILEMIVKVSEGKQVKAEINGQNDFSIWRLATSV
ncbi:UxaA family hydrolase [Helicobacter sp. 11S03491-1]|uniref:UxaA family hydrolase n=1 Tax=Helicobacter sp. 11S03491-1 TaxID=1476196 RepID=UPI000BA509CF|nr:UxaA family hydrolase [Helicobacter sp. 11S03491-1]PAF42285.1 altronate hydrolase [Helicobacter sp. 11S03491-1]